MSVGVPIYVLQQETSKGWVTVPAVYVLAQDFENDQDPDKTDLPALASVREYMDQVLAELGEGWRLVMRG